MYKDFTNAGKLITLGNPVMMFFIFVATTTVGYVDALIIMNPGGIELMEGGLTAPVTYGAQTLL